MAVDFRISASVGKEGKNEPRDVVLIQVFLNQIPPENGGAEAELKVDGLMGPSTQAAIDKFQHHHQLGSDGRIDPNGKIMVKLNELISATLSPPSPPPPVLPNPVPSSKSPANAVIMGIWGRGGAGDSENPENGIANWLSSKTPELTALGVPADHIFSMSWNPAGNDDALGHPATALHIKELFEREPNPSYLALIGHSFGGRSVCLLSSFLTRSPDYIALLDPVFGPFGDFEDTIKPVGDVIDNWYQRNAIALATELEDCLGAVTGCFFGVSCGREIEGVNNHLVEFMKDSNGTPLMRPCITGGEAKRHITHITIDSDEFIWGNIIARVMSDIANLAG